MAEPEPVRILDKLTEHSDFHTAILLTYGADLAFFEEAVLYPLWLNGCRNVLVFMDAERYADTLRDLRASVTWVGRRYIVIPVDLGPHRSFHPKLVLLLGSERGRLLIGSGNLTFTGFGHNWEIFTCLDWTPEEGTLQHLFVDSWRMVHHILDRWGHSAEASSILGKAASVASWLRSEVEPNTDTRVLHSLEQPLIDQVTGALAGETIERLTVLSPFLDDAGRAVAELHSRFDPPEVRLVLQHHRTVGKLEALESLLGKGVPLAIHRFADDERYLHAKIYIFETTERAYVFTGSANCTRSGLLSSSSEGNLEVMLLHRAASRQHYGPLVDGHMWPRAIESLDEIAIVEDPPFSPAADSTGIRLLDVSVAGGLLSVAFRLGLSLDGTSGLELRLSTTPPRFVPLGKYAAGQTHRCESALAQDLQQALTRPVFARLQVTDREDAPSELSSNELWVTNVDVLRYELIRLLPDDERAATNLREILVTSDEEWGDLYECLTRLIALDVETLKRRGAAYTTSPIRHRGAIPGEDSDHDVTVTLADHGNEARERGEVASDLFQESPLHAWLEHVSGRLPGAVSAPQVEDDEPTEQSARAKVDEKSPRPRWAPSERLGRRFINLVKKYVSSLGNAHYMETASIYLILHYYSTFQLITWLLLEHKVVDTGRFIELVMAINRGFFGGRGDDAPILNPCLRKHMQRLWSDEWRDAEVPYYACASMAVSEAMARRIADDALAAEVREQNLRVLCGVLSVMGVSWALAGDMQTFAHGGVAYGQGRAALATGLVETVDRDLSSICTQLGKWTSDVKVALGKPEHPRLAQVLGRARLDYALAWYETVARFGDISTQTSLCSDLVYWARGAGDSDEATKWGEILVNLLREQGKGLEAARAMYHRGTLLFVDQAYEDAANVLRQAALLAKRLGDTELHGRCEQYLGHTDFFLQQL